MTSNTTPSSVYLEDRDWPALLEQIDSAGHAVIPGLLPATTCDAIAALYDDATLFRSRIIMARHAFGEGEYQYFSTPLPPDIGVLRQALYSHLAPLANRWSENLGEATRYPADLGAFTRQCHEAGQTLPTPLLLRYGAGGYNRLHRDLYGEIAFPLQVVVMLSQPGDDFVGGEFVLTEQKPRSQSRVEVIPLAKGDACIFAVQHRPAKGSRGYYRSTLRHGVSTVRSGNRRTLGIIFHDAR